MDEKHKNITEDNAMLLAKVQELQNSVPELEVNTTKHTLYTYEAINIVITFHSIETIRR